MGQIIRKGVEYGSSGHGEVREWIGTMEEYDALPNTKLTDGVNYYIVDYNENKYDKSAAAGVIGEVIAYMGKTAPDHFLVCDGTEYAISSYPTLAAHIKTEFGSINYFGGDGEKTFAVPDLRGEFLRGSGTNSHTNQGNGADVGKHQDGTEIPNMWNYNGTITGSYKANECLNVAKPDKFVNPLSSETNQSSATNTSKGTGGYPNSHYIPRPTNTSVLYCIRYAKDNTTEISYSTEEQFTGKYWVDGKKIYQKSMILNSIPEASMASGVVIGNINIPTIQDIIDMNYILNPRHEKDYATFEGNTICTYSSQYFLNFCGFWIRANGDIVATGSVDDKIINTVYFTIQYTKTEE